MRHFILRLLCFGILVLMLLIGLDVFISNRLKNSTDRRFVVWNDITNGNIDADMLIMGSSRAWVHYSPQILDSILNLFTYNIGIDGSTFNRQIERYKIYRLYNRKPSYIIQNIDFFSTLGYRIGYEREQYFPYLINRQCMSIFQEPFYWYEYIPFNRYVGYSDLMKDAIHNEYKNNQNLYKGYGGQNAIWDGKALNDLDSIEFTYNKCVKDMFIDYIAQAKRDSITMIFVYAPFYIEGLRKVTNLEESFAIFDSIANEFDVPILDYTYSYLSYDTTYFYNASHLNKQGAELFSTMLANDLDSLGIIH